jgi:hypothetical protein
MTESNNAATLEDAIAIAANAHKGQFDKAGAPYILHPLRIMMKMKSDAAMIVAVLHDVVEDAPDWTLDRLRETGFTDEIIRALECVTKREGEEYSEFVKRAASNPIAREVKIGDLEDNMNIQRIESISAKDSERIAKYHKYWKILTSGASVDVEENDTSITHPPTERDAYQHSTDDYATRFPDSPSKLGIPVKPMTPEDRAECRKIMDELLPKMIQAMHEDNQNLT